MDPPGYSSASNPITENAFIYGDGDPEDFDDPTGHFGVPYGWLNYGIGSGGVGREILGYESDVLALESVTETGASDYLQNQVIAGIGKDGIGFSNGTASTSWSFDLSDIIDYAETVLNNVVGGGIYFTRHADFFCLSFSAGGPASYAVSIEIDRYGDWFFSPIGASVGFSPFPVSVSLVGGWLDQGAMPSEFQLTNLLSRWSLSWGASAPGACYFRQWNSSGYATLAGSGSPQVGVSFSWTFEGPGKTGLTWND